MIGRWLVFAGAMAASSPALAAPVSDEEIIVTAPLEGSRIESLQGSAVLTREDIADNLVGGLGETVDHLPGVSSSFFGAGASRPVIRGLGDDRVRVLENGIGAIDAASASPDHAPTADGLDAERIEVLRGAAALAYGGNAVGGVVNVIDQSIPRSVPEGGHSVDVLAAVSTVDEGTQGALGASFAAGPVVFRLDVGARKTDAYDIPGFARSAALREAEPLEDGETDVEGVAPNSDTDTRSYAGGAAFVGDWGFSGVAVKRYETEYGLPPEDAGATLGGHIELEQTRYEARGDIKVAFGPFNRVDYGAQYSDYTHTEFEDTGEAGTKFNNEGWEGRIEAHHGEPEAKLRGAVGLQYTDTDFEAVGEEAFITPSSTKDIGVFVVERWDQGLYGVEGGLRLEQRKLDNAGAGKADFDTVSASLGAFARPAENWFVGATLARVERAPTAIELFAEGPHLATAAYEIGDPTIKEETATSLEGSLRFTTARVQFELNAYRAQFDDYIALVPNGLLWIEEDDLIIDPAVTLLPADAATLPVFVFTAQDTTFTGGEISLAGTIATVAGTDLRGDIAADIVRAEFDAGGDVPRIPARTATVGFEAERGPILARIEAVDVANQKRTATFETPTDGYTLFNARLAVTPIEGNPLRIVLEGRNLTDEEAREHVSFLKDVLPRPGRNVRLALTTRF